jgi:pyruvate, water dikinase
MIGKERSGFNSIIHDAISSMDNSSDQKAVNINQEARNSETIDAQGLLGNKIAAVPIGPFSGPKPGTDTLIKWFSEINNKDIGTVGGKGASLGEMFNNNFPVPLGFVITAQAFDYFISNGDTKEKIKDVMSRIDYEETEELTKASKIIRKIIESQEIPDDLRKEILEAYNILSSERIDEKGISSDALNILKNAQEPIFVSVRSSATTEDLVDASFAGQQESFLNVKGSSSLISHVKRCFSSLYTPRAMYYRNKKGFKEGEALLAVVVQKMVDSEKSGVVFSRNPIGDEEEVAIEAVFGLGEGIVSGKINPDHYIVTRDLKVDSTKVSNKKIAIVRTGSGQNEIVKLSEEKSKSQVLTSGEILGIANYAIKLEEHYKKPQDIEFAIEGREIFIVQSRPITTLGKKGEAREIDGNVILEGQSASPGIGSGAVKLIRSMADLPKIKKGDILVTEMTNPDMVVAMQKSAAIVTDEGGMTSHAAIVSREMGIPAIVGTDTATKDLQDGMRITVDGSNGKVYEGEVAESQVVEIKPAVETSKIKIKVIVDLPNFASRAAETGIKEVGLTRLEGIIASMKKHPLQYQKENKLEDYSKVIEEGLSKIMSYFRKVWFRASDVRTDEYSSLTGAPEREINPMLGFHGIRFSLKHPEILKAELAAMKSIASKNPDKKIGIMFPQVISIEEVKEARKYFDEVKLDNMEFGVMIETPAAVQIIEQICEEVDFVSFGTNDLTQYTLAVDRNNEDVQYLYNEMHPAIYSQIEKVIDACNDKQVETSICGQAGSKREMAEFLFKKGIKSISVNADAAQDISQLIKELEDAWTKEDEENRMKEEEDRRKSEEEEKQKEENERMDRERTEKEESEKLQRERDLEEQKRQEQERFLNEKQMIEEEKKKFEEEKKMIEEEKNRIVEEKKRLEDEKAEKERKEQEIRENEEEARKIREEEARRKQEEERIREDERLRLEKEIAEKEREEKDIGNSKEYNNQASEISRSDSDREDQKDQNKNWDKKARIGFESENVQVAIEPPQREIPVMSSENIKSETVFEVEEGMQETKPSQDIIHDRTDEVKKEAEEQKNDEDYRKSKKYQKYLKWKEKKKEWVKKKKEEKQDSWDKKARIGFEESKSSETNEVVDPIEERKESDEIEKKRMNEIKEIQEKTDTMDDKSVELVDDLERIEDRSEEIEERIEDKKDEQLAEREEKFDAMSVKDNSEIENSIPDQEIQEIKSRIPEVKEEAEIIENVEKEILEEKTIETEIKPVKDDNDLIMDAGKTEDFKDQVEELKEDRPDIDDFKENGEEKKKEVVGGGNPEEFEEIGVYNPEDEESKEDKSKYNYNFEDWE